MVNSEYFRSTKGYISHFCIIYPQFTSSNVQSDIFLSLVNMETFFYIFFHAICRDRSESSLNDKGISRMHPVIKQIGKFLIGAQLSAIFHLVKYVG